MQEVEHALILSKRDLLECRESFYSTCRGLTACQQRRLNASDSDQIQALVIFFRGRNGWYPLSGRLSGLHGRIGRFGAEMNPLPLAGNPTTIPRSSIP